jgi:hypothetical protein
VTELTFTQVTNSAAIDRRPVLVYICHQELSEVPDDRSANAVIRNPFDNGLRLDVAQLLKGNFLRKSLSVKWTGFHLVMFTYIFDAFKVVHITSLIILSPGTPLHFGDPEAAIHRILIFCIVAI